MMERIERAKHLFEIPRPLGQKEFIEFFFDNDHVALIAQEEANIKGTAHWSPRFAVPADRFVQNGSYAVTAKAADIEWVMDLVV